MTTLHNEWPKHENRCGLTCGFLGCPATVPSQRHHSGQVAPKQEGVQVRTVDFGFSPVDKPRDWSRFEEDTINLSGYPILVLQGLNFRKLQVPLESVHPQECQAGFVESVPSLSLSSARAFSPRPIASVASNGSPSLQRRWQEAEGSLKLSWRRSTVADTSTYLHRGISSPREI